MERLGTTSSTTSRGGLLALRAATPRLRQRRRVASRGSRLSGGSVSGMSPAPPWSAIAHPIPSVGVLPPLRRGWPGSTAATSQDRSTQNTTTPPGGWGSDSQSSQFGRMHAFDLIATTLMLVQSDFTKKKSCSWSGLQIQVKLNIHTPRQISPCLSYSDLLVEEEKINMARGRPIEACVGLRFASRMMDLR